MKSIISTNSRNTAALIGRLALGLVLFAHGAQKLFGWFGGYGYTGTMGFLTGQAHLPYVIALLVILIESIGALFLLAGFLTRIAAFAVLAEFTGVVVKVHWANGFFMNWGGTQKGEGIEYFVLLLGISIMLLIMGGGQASVDAAISRSEKPQPARTNLRAHAV